MSKAIFRWLRGELNGFYLTSMHNTLNNYTQYISKFFTDFNKMQFDTTTMDSDTIYNIGKFAGVFLPRISAGEGYGAFRMTESEIKNNEERSERGLYSRDTETFDFSYSEDETADINTHATSSLRSSVPGTNDEVKGYISSEETDVLDDDGNVKEGKYTTTPPEDVAYSDFFGNQFSFLSDDTNETNNIGINVYYPLYKVMQWIRYNGVNIVSFAKLVDILCPNGLVKIRAITKAETAPYFNVTYTYNTEVKISNKNQRLATFKYIVGLKFPQFVLSEIMEV